ncbi:MAG TPA: hypothetical protein PKA63_02045 [Oligoflexia bacterium]|nr:hypothetical protein [Oligoflexia bacterium]HMP47432.1 hypothetical protein [Oligoflexia bacterium]
MELWTFYEDGNREGRFAITDEGGLYVFEYHPNSNVETNGNQVLGYAFAIICNTPSDQKIQIMPLYTSLEKGIVYHRNVFLEVSSDITMCVQPQI